METVKQAFLQNAQTPTFEVFCFSSFVIFVPATEKNSVNQKFHVLPI